MDGTGVADSSAMAALMDTGRDLRADVGRVLAPALDRTRRVAADPAVLAALRDADPDAATAACNRAILASTEIDAVTLFDHAGQLVAINTVYASGRPIAADRLGRIPRRNLGCGDQIDAALRCPGPLAAWGGGLLQFQTKCDITPALFDSSGLSVAYSVPVVDPSTGRAVGVVSSRLRFDRLLDLTRGRSVGGGGTAALVTDQGRYFSEDVNAGRARAPVGPAVLAGVVAPLLHDGADSTVTRHGDDYLGLFRLTEFRTVNGGGLQVLLVARGSWLAREARGARLVRAGGAAGVGLLLAALAALVPALASVRRLQARTAEVAQRLDLAMDAGGFGSWDADVATGHLVFDERFARLLGVPLASLKPHRSELLSRVHPDDLPGVQSGIAEHLAGRTPVYRNQHRVRHADGSWRWNSAAGRVVARAADGRPLRLVGTFADITEHKETEAKLAEARRLESEVRLAASRSAGMAEVATGVLHNVGNVLNSVNVSADLIRDRLAAGGAGGLARAVALIDAHRDDLAGFLTADPKGRQLPAYLGLLARALAEERASVLAELDSLTRGVDHIKRVVAMQQDAARSSATVRERCRPAALLEDALRFNLMSLERHRVTVVRDLADVPDVDLDKHKTLQILVNLIGNAKNALKGPDDGDGGGGGGDGRRRELTLRVAAALADGRPCVRFAVADTGCGIAAEHLTRIFTHGFTTRSAGHGFGLHSAANAAREMGGSLTVASDGPGRGATFTLDVPVAPAAAATGIPATAGGAGTTAGATAGATATAMAA